MKNQVQAQEEIVAASANADGNQDELEGVASITEEEMSKKKELVKKLLAIHTRRTKLVCFSLLQCSQPQKQTIANKPLLGQIHVENYTRQYSEK